MKRFFHRLRTIDPSEVAFHLREGIDVFRERRLERPEKLRIDEIRAPNSSLLPVNPFAVFCDQKGALGLWREQFPHSVEETVALAEGICDNRIPLFSEIVPFDGKIDWHAEYTTGRRSPLKFYRDIHALNSEHFDDVKVVWEPNRHNFTIFLGKAYWATGDRRYYDAWRVFLLDWIDSNPYNIGINWQSSLELSIRAINWIWTCFFFTEELKRDRDLQERMFLTLYRHGFHIRRHLSRYFSPNTHLTGEALGLLYLGMCYPQMRSSSEWARSAREILEAELWRQILDDGGYFEMATYYHKYTVDFYVHYLALIGETALPKGDILSRIHSSIKHLALLCEPDGTIPLWGDSDGGQLLSFNRRKSDVRGACCTGAVLLRDGELKHLCGDVFHEEALWLTGTAGFGRFGEIESAPLKVFHSVNRQTGLYVFRSGMQEEDGCLSIDCGVHGWGACGHSHSDLLSFEWYSDGNKVLVDPGTYKYSGPNSLRNAYRRSQDHNTITINDISQSVPGDVFKWKRIAHPLYSLSAFVGDVGYFEGAHDAYERFDCSHRRIVLFFGRELSVVIDRLHIKETVSSLLYGLHFNEGEVRTIGDTLYQYEKRGGGGKNCIRIFGDVPLIAAVLEGEIFPDYNKKVKAPRLELRGKNICGSHNIIALLSCDRRLVEGFRCDDRMGLRCEDSPYEYCISFGDCCDGRGAGHPGSDAYSAIRSGLGQVVIMMRNASRACNAQGMVCFETEDDQDLLLAVLEGDALYLSAGQPPSTFSVPYDIGSVYVGDVPVRFEKEGGTIRLGGVP